MCEVKSVTIKTKNINESIDKFCLENDLENEFCDFKIKKIETYIKDYADKEFKLFNEDLKEHLKDTNKVLNEHIELTQSYEILIAKVTQCKIKLKYKVQFGAQSSHPVIIISPQSHIPYKLYQPRELLTLIYKEINKIKARNNILLNIYDDTMVKNLKAFVKYIYAGKFKKNVKLSLFNGIVPEITQESKLVYHFLQKDNANQVIEVEEDEVLVTFYKPRFGRNGLNCFGSEINSEYANNKGDLEREVDLDSISIKENDTKKEYISKIKGFVHLTKTAISIDQKIKMKTLSRNQSSLASVEDNSIEVVVSQKDTNKDSIGEGVELVSETVNVSGHIGAKSKIEATHLNIEGATHKDSKQFAKFAVINRHKGTLRAHEAKINILEGGVVHATQVNIKTALGGSVYAQDVTIDHVKSNLKVFASNSITIRLISGEDNKFKINYKDINILINKINYLRNEIENLEYSLEEALRHTNSAVNGIKAEINSLKSKIQAIENSVKTAKISIEKPMVGLNTIAFTINNDEIIYKTSDTTYSPFYLEVTQNKITLHPVNKSILIEN